MATGDRFNVGEFVEVGTAFRIGAVPGQGRQVPDEYTGTKWYVATALLGDANYGLARTMDGALAGDPDVYVHVRRICRAECPWGCGNACTRLQNQDGARDGLCDRCADERPETDDGWNDDKSAFDF